MRLSAPNVSPTRRITSLSLDHGADADECEEVPIELCERGFHLKSRWQFEIGTQLQVSITWPGLDSAQHCFAAEGVVVWCEPLPGFATQLYKCTLLFLEVPLDSKRHVREFSSHLKAWK